MFASFWQLNVMLYLDDPSFSVCFSSHQCLHFLIKSFSRLLSPNVFFPFHIYHFIPFLLSSFPHSSSHCLGLPRCSFTFFYFILFFDTFFESDAQKCCLFLILLTVSLCMSVFHCFSLFFCLCLYLFPFPSLSSSVSLPVSFSLSPYSPSLFCLFLSLSSSPSLLLSFMSSTSWKEPATTFFPLFLHSFLLFISAVWFS